MTLLMASLYAVDVSVLETCEDSDEILLRLPMTSDVEYMKQVRNRCSEASFPLGSIKAKFCCILNPNYDS